MITHPSLMEFIFIARIHAPDVNHAIGVIIIKNFSRRRLVNMKRFRAT
jgi:hypothetical protein